MVSAFLFKPDVRVGDTMGRFDGRRRYCQTFQGFLRIFDQFRDTSIELLASDGENTRAPNPLTVL